MIEITEVFGERNAGGDLTGLRVRGTASHSTEVSVEIQCSASPKQQVAPVVNGEFAATLSQAELQIAECRCGGPVIVMAVDPTTGESARWRGSLDCDGGNREPADPPEDQCPGSSEILENCAPPAATDGPQHTLNYTQLLRIDDIGLADQIDVSRPNPVIGNLVVATGSIGVHIASQLNFEQRWFLADHQLHDLIATISLAPHESLRLAFKNTQRKRLTQKTIDSTEELDSRESTAIDRDVVNVARSVSKTKNWKVDGNASFSVKGFNAGVSGSYSSTVNRASQSTSNSISEATKKSANSLKTLQKTEIEEVSEELDENLTSRVLINPYHDRTVLVKVYDQVKKYCVETELVAVLPVLLIDVRDLPFNRRFVLRYGDFLEDALLDTALKLSLTEALEAANELNDEREIQRAIEIAELALRYLFEQPPTMFNVAPISPFFGGGPDPNDPANSFDALLNRSGLADAISNNLGVVFTTLAFYYQVYQEKLGPAAVPSPSTTLDDRFAIDFAVALEGSVSPLWQSIEDAGNLRNILDQANQTEIFRRLSGFLSIISGMVKPVVQPLEEQRDMDAARRRAENVIRRTTEHLEENSYYYTREFLRYLEDSARSDLMSQFSIGAVEATTLANPQQLLDLVDIDSIYRDGSFLVVPARNDKAIEDFKAFSNFLSESGDDEPIEDRIDVSEVEVPCEGVHLEATAGRCILEGLPERKISVIESAGATLAGRADVGIDNSE